MMSRDTRGKDSRKEEGQGGGGLWSLKPYVLKVQG
jgi:hypothetical protein